MGRTLVLTCEHAGNLVPAHLAAFFNGASVALKTHRGWDLGAEEVCRELAEQLHCIQTFYGEYSRLVVDLNRSENHPKVFSQWTEGLNPVETDYLLESIHRPFRRQVMTVVEQAIAQGDDVLHLSIHSFTPILAGEVRTCEIGLLYDPQRKTEQAFAIGWEKNIEKHSKAIVRRNYPYRGIADGHTTDLRKRFRKGYMGFEIELNQSYLETVAPQTVASLLALCLPG